MKRQRSQASMERVRVLSRVPPAEYLANPLYCSGSLSTGETFATVALRIDGWLRSQGGRKKGASPKTLWEYHKWRLADPSGEQLFHGGEAETHLAGSPCAAWPPKPTGDKIR